MPQQAVLRIGAGSTVISPAMVCSEVYEPPASNFCASMGSTLVRDAWCQHIGLDVTSLQKQC